MKSIDAGIVQRMFGDDVALFKSLLGRMLRDYADLPLALAGRLDDTEACRALEERVHKLKGSAGMIGAALKKLCAALAALQQESAALLDAPALAGMLDMPRFERLQRAVENLDFQAGAVLLREGLSAGAPRNTG